MARSAFRTARTNQPFRAPSELAGARVAALPAAPQLTLASATLSPPNGEEWLHEIKFDGYRIAATLNRGVRLTTRNKLDWTAKFPGIVKALESLPVATAIVDGEIVAVGQDGRSDFGALQRWLGAGWGADPESGVRVLYQAFDLLYLEGHDLRDVALEERKALLAQVLAAKEGNGPLRFTEHLEFGGQDVFAAACSLRLEGLVSKLRGSPYRPGRQRHWLKCTCLTSGDFVVGGFTAPRGSRVGFGALLLGEPDDDGLLRYVGKVGTGFDDVQLAALRSHLDELVVDTSPFATAVPRVAIRPGVTWLEPELVAEVAYSERTGNGYLRQARYRGLRPDKAASDVNAVEQRLSVPRAGTDARGRSHPEENQVAKKKAKSAGAQTAVAGVRLTNPDRVVYAEQGVTKKDLAEYYAAVGEHLLRHAGLRPLSLVRCPEGNEKHCFYQKHPGPAFAADLPRARIEESDGVQDYLYLESVPDIVALVQAGVLEIHAWGSTVNDLERPDMLVFDLDPAEKVPFDFTKKVARQTRNLLGELGLSGFLKSTGGKGLHVVVPLEPDAGWDEAKVFAKGVAEALAASDPKKLTTSVSKAARSGKVFIDYLRNGRGATAVTPYSTRARTGAPVAVPLRWDELTRLKSSAAYDMRSVRRRLASLNEDPWAGFDAARRPLSEALAKVEAA